MFSFKKKKQKNVDYHFEKDIFCGLRSIEIPLRMKVTPTDSRFNLDKKDIEVLNIMASILDRLESDVDESLANDEVFREQYKSMLTKVKSIVRSEILKNPVRLIVRTNNHSLYFVEKQGDFLYDADGDIYTRHNDTLYLHHGNNSSSPEIYAINNIWALDPEAKKWL